MSNAPSPAPIARLRGEFSCATTEVGFLHQQSGLILRDLRRALILFSVVYMLFGVTDVLALGLPGALAPMLTRALVAALAFAGLRHASRAAAPVRAAYRLSTAFTLLVMASYLVVVYCRPQDALVHGMSTALLSLAIVMFIPNRLPTAFVIAVCFSLAVLMLAWHQHTASTRHLISITMMLVVANTFGAVGAHRQARLWREQYWAQQVLTSLSVRDPLTGCYNRRHLNAALLDGEFARARRYRLHLALIMCDLDGFKAINDTHGHHAGDELLRSFAALLQSMTRDAVDTVVRYGGEEFLILLPETPLDGAVELAERIRAAFAAQRTQVGTVELGTTASFGVVGADFAATQALTSQALIAAADELMYDAKRGGRNQVRSHQLVPGIGSSFGWAAA
jgi:diguanylate cyclase (GGDEF)-like protein